MGLRVSEVTGLDPGDLIDLGTDHAAVVVHRKGGKDAIFTWCLATGRGLRHGHHLPRYLDQARAPAYSKCTLERLIEIARQKCLDADAEIRAAYGGATPLDLKAEVREEFRAFRR